MKKQFLQLYRARDETLRAIFRTSHGRMVFLAMELKNNYCTIIDYYYTDRIKSGKHFAIPKKFKTMSFPLAEICNVIAKELDRTFDGFEIVEDLSDLSTNEFIQRKTAEFNRGYKFLIFIGEGEVINGIPSVLRTRFKNRIHRSIYLEIQYRNSRGVVSDCHYYDRKYKSRASVTPQMLSTVYFEYNRQTLLNIINNELNTAFTDIIFVTDRSLDISRKQPLCGYIT